MAARADPDDSPGVIRSIICQALRVMSLQVGFAVEATKRRRSPAGFARAVGSRKDVSSNRYRAGAVDSRTDLGGTLPRAARKATALSSSIFADSKKSPSRSISPCLRARISARICSATFGGGVVMLRGYSAHVRSGTCLRIAASEIGGLISAIEFRPAPYLFFQPARGLGCESI
jgi:hypothetical protein